MKNNITNTDQLLFEQKGQTGWLTLNRPDSLNSVNIDIINGLQRAMDHAEENGDLRALVITGEGRAFCAGADLKRANADQGQADEDELANQFIDAVHDMMNRLEQLPIPVITALNGITLGAGLELALCSDIIVAKQDAKIGDGHARFGLLPGGGGSARLPRRIGEAAAKWLLFTGDLIPAAELMHCGLIQRVYPSDDFIAEVGKLADTISGRSPIGLKRMKELTNHATTSTLEEALEKEKEMMRLHRTSWDRSEGLKAFAEKRKPLFRGE